MTAGDLVNGAFYLLSGGGVKCRYYSGNSAKCEDPFYCVVILLLTDEGK